MDERIGTVLTFWFEEAGPEAWWKKSEVFDALVRMRFEALHENALTGACDAWRETPHGILALILLFDQFPRNMYRNTPRAFATDARARALTREAIERGHDLSLTTDEERQFIYMPLMHSEDLADQDEAVRLGETRMANDNFHKYAHAHRDVIARFGRFPHRNAILGRTSTPEEEEYLAAGGGF